MHQDGKSKTDQPVRLRDPARQQVYRSARSHSGRVRAAKLALPVLAVAIVLGTGAWMWLSRLAPDIGVDIADTAIRGGKLVMANPKLDGLTSDDRPYSVRAARAIQSLSGGDGIDLERLQADVPLNADVNARIVAAAGLYDSESNTLDLRDSITVQTDDGMRAELQSAKVNFENGRLSTLDPVRISMPGAVIEADRLTVEENGRRLFFESRVRLVVEPSKFKPPESSGLPAAGAQTGN